MKEETPSHVDIILSPGLFIKNTSIIKRLINKTIIDRR